MEFKIAASHCQTEYKNMVMDLYNLPDSENGIFYYTIQVDQHIRINVLEKMTNEKNTFLFVGNLSN